MASQTKCLDPPLDGLDVLRSHGHSKDVKTLSKNVYSLMILLNHR